MMFGAHKNVNSEAGLTRLIVRDASLSAETRKSFEEQLEVGKPYLEEKSENTINRKTGTAQNPRTLERVPAGAEFEVEFIIQVYEGDNVDLLEKTLKEGLTLVEQTYLGGSGSRVMARSNSKWSR